MHSRQEDRAYNCLAEACLVIALSLERGHYGERWFGGSADWVQLQLQLRLGRSMQQRHSSLFVHQKPSFPLERGGLPGPHVEMHHQACWFLPQPYPMLASREAPQGYPGQHADVVSAVLIPSHSMVKHLVSERSRSSAEQGVCNGVAVRMESTGSYSLA